MLWMGCDFGYAAIGWRVDFFLGWSVHVDASNCQLQLPNL